MKVRAYVHEAILVLDPRTDPRAVGATVTTALCGHWKHDGACRWPHNNHIHGTRFRTLFVATPDDEPEVRRRIRDALHGQPEWRVESDRSRDVAPGEEELAVQLTHTPRRKD